MTSRLSLFNIKSWSEIWKGNLVEINKNRSIICTVLSKVHYVRQFFILQVWDHYERTQTILFRCSLKIDFKAQTALIPVSIVQYGLARIPNLQVLL